MRRLTLVEDEVRLIGVICDTCGHGSIPTRRLCPNCGSSSVQETAFGPRATVLRWTALHVPVEGMNVPYCVGLLQLAEGLVVFSRIEGEPTRGATAVLAGNIKEDRFWFTVETGRR